MVSKGRVRAADVAEEAGVSTATVSYVLNDTPGQKISATTTARVREVAKRLGYVSNTAAQTLARGKSTFVVLDMSDFLTQESAAVAAEPFLTKIREVGFEPFMTWWPADLDGATRAERLVRFARATNPAAVISILPLEDDLQDELRFIGVASISSVVHAAEDLVPALALSAQTQVEYLAAQGHTHILYAASNQPALDHLVEVRRATGAAASSELGVRWTALPRYDDVASLTESIERTLASDPDASAIAAYNDADALAVLFALHYLRLEIPGRMAVIGIDNEAYSGIAHPRLTTVAIGFDASQIDGDQLLRAIQGEGTVGFLPDPQRIVRPEVVIRESA